MKHMNQALKEMEELPRQIYWWGTVQIEDVNFGYVRRWLCVLLSFKNCQEVSVAWMEWAQGAGRGLKATERSLIVKWDAIGSFKTFSFKKMTGLHYK